MATLKNLTISDTGYMRLPQGTTAQRPTTPSITLVGFNKPLGIAVDGLQLWITNGTAAWNTFYGLPVYLKGLQCTTSINDSDSTSFSTTHAVRVYLMRQTAWNATDTTGWTTVETGKPYMGTSNTTDVYYKDFAAGGPYTIDNNSAMYLFNFIAGGTTLSVGAMRYNTTTGTNELWDGSQWVSMTNSVVSATGGSITGAVSAGGYVVHTFTSNGTFRPTYSGTVELLVVGGGGCGAGLSGGGGGGGVVYTSSYQVQAGVDYPVTVGAGGPGPASHSPGSGATSGQGGNSQFGGSSYAGVVAYGGGHGGYWTGPAAPGGSGGGGPGHNSSNGQRPAGEGVVGQGHPGGYGHHGSGPAQWLSPQPGICIYGGGGGGGAGEKGHSRYSYNAEAKGGNGIASTITGIEATYFGGGGGGGVHGPSGNYGRDYATGGLGGGGSSYSGGPQARHHGRANTGGGGAGAFHPDTYASGNGGTGIVVVRYRK